MAESGSGRGALEAAVSRHVMQGAVVISQTEREAIVGYPSKPVNHTLHAILSFLTACLWAIVWAVIAGTAKKETRIRITLLPDGSIREERITVQ